LGSTRKISATCRGVSSRSGCSMGYPPTLLSAPAGCRAFRTCRAIVRQVGGVDQRSGPSAAPPVDGIPPRFAYNGVPSNAPSEWVRVRSSQLGRPWTGRSGLAGIGCATPRYAAHDAEFSIWVSVFVLVPPVGRPGRWFPVPPRWRSPHPGRRDRAAVYDPAQRRTGAGRQCRGAGCSAHSGEPVPGGFRWGCCGALFFPDGPGVVRNRGAATGFDVVPPRSPVPRVLGR
jgi:hypothetical protein